MNNELFNLYKYKTKNCDLNDYLLIRSLFMKLTLDENYKRLCSCSLTCIKIIFIIFFIMNDDRLIINLLIVIFNFFRDEHDDFEFKQSSSLKLQSKSF